MCLCIKICLCAEVEPDVEDRGSETELQVGENLIFQNVLIAL